MLKKLVLACLSTALFGWGAANAATLKATGSVLGGISVFQDFEIEFEDTNGSQTLDFDEITSFSGVVTGIGSIRNDFTTLLAIPSIPGLVEPSGGGMFWVFAGTQSVFTSSSPIQSSLGTNPWTYELVGLAPVPLPAAAWFFLSAIIGAGLYRKIRRVVSWGGQEIA